ncbi:calcium homeostasis modulator protein 5 [Meleagris gallopavo]|uniref:Calcium homeostasis modulator family member 5 n=1 Tax=Meleagris gallopavo TaxID=9103 RepID=A0A803XPK7_MELGA|nr:calcium homeostasis modulator protein 5 [Meleagris gallopavo]
MEGFRTILKFFMNRRTAIGYSVMALLTLGSERAFSLVAFRCPCSNENFKYGLVFLFSPAFVLLVFGYFLNNKTWKLFTGCWVNPRKIFPEGNVCHFFIIFGQITLNALVAPVMWLSVALLNGTFYECAMSGLRNPAYLDAICHNKSVKCFEELHKVSCGKSTMPFSESEELKLTLQAHSQILGWCVIMAMALFSLLTICCASCQSKVSHLQLMFWKVYAEKEKEQLEQTFQLYATKLSERNLKCFFENRKPEVMPLPAFQAWEDASQLYTFSSSKQHYSTIHRLVEEGQKEVSEERETTYDFVDRREIP